MDFNDFTQKFTKKVKQLSKDTAEEVQRLNKVRQLNGKVNDAKKQIENIYSQIGKQFYELYKDSAPEGFEEFIRTINDKTVEIGQLMEQVREAKGVVLCPSCNTEVSGDERFCPNCGSRLPESVENAAAEDEASVVVDAEDVTVGAKEAAADLAEDAKEAAADMAEEAKEAAEDVKEAAADVAEDAKEAVADAAGDAKEAAQNIAGDVQDAAAEAADGLKDAAEDFMDAAKEKAGEIAEGAKKIAGNAVDELKEAAGNLKDDIEKMF